MSKDSTPATLPSAKLLAALKADRLEGWTLFACFEDQWKQRRICTTGDNAKAKCRATLWPGCLSNRQDRYDLFVILDPQGEPWMFSNPLWSATRVVWKPLP